MTFFIGALGFLWILIGFACAVFPAKTNYLERKFYRKLRLISVEKFSTPLTKRKIIWVSFQGWLFLIAGIFLFGSASFHLYSRYNMPSQITLPSDFYVNKSSVNFKPEIDKIIEPLIRDHKSVGITVGIFCNGHKEVFGYGSTAFGNNIVPDGNTIYEIGSITKVFTSLLLADMVGRGGVNLNDPVNKYLPPSVHVTDCNNIDITLGDLASHLSGLPRLPDNIISLNLNNPYASYTPAQLYNFLSRYSLQSQPGTKYLYSNLGVGLLGHVLSENQKLSYQQLVSDRICIPLNMNDTTIDLSDQQKKRLAKGYKTVVSFSLFNIPVPASNWDIPTLSGAGALRSTANDLLKFLSANINPDNTPLASTIKLTHIPRFDINPELSIAMGWHIEYPKDSDQTVYCHNGGTGGYTSFIGFNKKYHTAVVVLNNSTASIDQAGFSILKILTDSQKSGPTAQSQSVDH